MRLQQETPTGDFLRRPQYNFPSFIAEPHAHVTYIANVYE